MGRKKLVDISSRFWVIEVWKVASSGTLKLQFWRREFSSSFVLYDFTYCQISGASPDQRGYGGRNSVMGEGGRGGGGIRIGRPGPQKSKSKNSCCKWYRANCKPLIMERQSLKCKPGEIIANATLFYRMGPSKILVNWGRKLIWGVVYAFISLLQKAFKFVN